MRALACFLAVPATESVESRRSLPLLEGRGVDGQMVHNSPIVWAASAEAQTRVEVVGTLVEQARVVCLLGFVAAEAATDGQASSQC